MDKHQVAKLLEEMALYLDLAGLNLFRVRAYRNAARVIENIDDLEEFLKENKLESLPGIGKDLSHKIHQILETGRLVELERLKEVIPEELVELLQIPGLGGKKIKILYDKLGVKNLDDLNEAIEKGELATLKGFGPKSQENVKNSLSQFRAYGRRILWNDAMKMAEPILHRMRKLKYVHRAEIAGSLRRKLETVGDIDFVVASDHPEEVMEWFIQQGAVSNVTARGATKCSVRLISGLQSDLRVVSIAQFPFALLYFTGSKEHCIQMRAKANERGLSMNEYSFTPLPESDAPSVLAYSEAEIYRSLSLQEIPPELREGKGEIEAAQEGILPNLIEFKDIKGTFHCHTSESDGRNTLEEMVKGAEELGWEYIGIADHSKASYQAHGLSEERLLAQVDIIRKLNKSQKFKVHVFAGCECDILEDGTLDFDNSILKELDFVVASIHRRFKQDKEQATARIIKALENPYTTMVGHLTGRILLRRPPNVVNVEKAIDAAIANGKMIEINGYPNRLDMDWRHWKKGKEKGLKCCINPDAHKVSELKFVETGVHIARKGWLEKEDVLNCFSLPQVLSFCKTRKWPSPKRREEDLREQDQ